VAAVTELPAIPTAAAELIIYAHSSWLKQWSFSLVLGRCHVWTSASTPTDCRDSGLRSFPRSLQANASTVRASYYATATTSGLLFGSVYSVIACCVDGAAYSAIKWTVTSKRCTGTWQFSPSMLDWLHISLRDVQEIAAVCGMGKFSSARSKVTGWDIGAEICCLGFPPSFQRSACMLPQITPLPLPFTVLPIHYSSSILTFNFTWARVYLSY
jgi:hypothetical protein